jgi:tripartite-type tricarboxylate transporter receptor subunit TctC
VIVPAASGSAVDALARVLGAKLNEAWHQPVVVENIVGVGGVTGAKAVAKSAPDGFTLGLVASNLAVAPSLYKESYDVAKEFTPITMVASAPLVLFVDPALPVKSVPELVALARSKPGALSFASAGNGSAAHLAGELFKATAGVDILHVPYSALPQGITDTVSGRVSMFFGAAVQGMPLAEAGKLRPLAVTGTRTVPAAPGVAPLRDSVPGYEIVTCFALVGPAGLPDAIVDQVFRDVTKIAGDKQYIDWLAAAGLDAVNSPPAVFKAALDTEAKKWAEVIKASGAKVE